MTLAAQKTYSTITCTVSFHMIQLQTVVQDALKLKSTGDLKRERGEQETVLL